LRTVLAAEVAKIKTPKKNHDDTRKPDTKRMETPFPPIDAGSLDMTPLGSQRVMNGYLRDMFLRSRGAIQPRTACPPCVRGDIPGGSR
jgi:hypothetical protein